MNILGEVAGKNAILVDDLIATGGSLLEAANALKKAGVRKIYAAVVHGVLSDDAIKFLLILQDSGQPAVQQYLSKLADRAGSELCLYDEKREWPQRILNLKAESFPGL